MNELRMKESNFTREEFDLYLLELTNWIEFYRAEKSSVLMVDLEND